ncbi:MAG: hypothetical protein ACO2O0_04740 [Desulfurococcales archaeon]
MIVLEIDLDNLYRSLNISYKHADRIVIKDPYIVVAEETSRAKIDDAEKLVATVEQIRNNDSLRRVLNIDDIDKVRIIVLLHSREIDPMIARKLSYDAKRCGVSLVTSSCNVAETLSRLGISRC